MDSNHEPIILLLFSNNDIILQILVPQTHFYGHAYLAKVLAMSPTQQK